MRYSPLGYLPPAPIYVLKVETFQSKLVALHPHGPQLPLVVVGLDGLVIIDHLELVT